MNTKLAALAVAAALALLAQPALCATVRERVVELLGPTAEPLLGVEANRVAIVNRLVVEHRATLFASGIAESSFRNALGSLRADQLLAAALVETFAEITAIVGQSQGMAAVTPKDGSGSGADSWIGYTAGSNLASGIGSAVTAGIFNLASGKSAFVGAGQSNVASGISSLVIGGFDNRATVIDAMVGAGAGNRATGARSVVVGGGYNVASGQWSFIGGGGRQNGTGVAGANVEDHIAGGSFSTIAGGQGNRAMASYAFVGGGVGNLAIAGWSTIGGGNLNGASATYSTVGGGISNNASGNRSTVGGGEGNEANIGYTFVGGGFFNTASGSTSTVGGGNSNVASGNSSIIGGGINNTAGGVLSTVGGGVNNVANGNRGAIGGGSENTAIGQYSTVPGGLLNTASGDYSVALGRRANAMHDGVFAFADSSDFAFNSIADNSFRVRATGGVRFVTGIDGNGATTWACITSDGNGWSCSSDRNLKQQLVELNGQAVLAKLASMPIYQWQPKGKNEHVKHFGPMAQDFHAAFELGDDDKMIGMQDADGVALAAIQGLNAKLEATLAQQARELAEERAARQLQAREIASLKLAVEVLLARTSPDAQVAVAR